MDAHGAVEIPLRRPAIDRDRQPLQNLRRVLAQHMRAQHALGLLVHHQLHHRPPRPARERVAHRGEAGEVDVGRAAHGRLVLAQPHRADRRAGEHRRRHRVQHPFARAGPIQHVGQGVPLGDRHRGQVQPVGHVAQGVDMRLAGAAVLVDGHRAEAVGGHSGGRQPQPVGIGGAADGGEHQVGLDAAAVGQHHAPRRALGRHSRHCGAAVQADALVGQRLVQRAAQILVEAAQGQVLAQDQVHLGAEAGEDAGEFHRDIAAADDGDARRHGLQVEGVVRDDAMLRAREVGPDRAAAGGNHDAFGGDALAAHLQRVRVDEGGARLEHGAAGAVHQLAVDAVQPADLAVLGGDQRGPVVPAGGDVPAETVAVGRAGAELAGHDHQLFGHAAHVDAGAAPEPLLRHADAGAVAGGDAGAAHAAGAAADDEEVEIIGHGWLRVRKEGVLFWKKEPKNFHSPESRRPDSSRRGDSSEQSFFASFCSQKEDLLIHHVPIPPRARYFTSRYSSIP